MAIAKLSIDLEAKLANLERDFSKATRIAEDNARRMKSAYSDVGRTFETLGAALAGAVGVNYLTTLVKSAVDAQDHLKDLSKSTSLTVEQLAGLSSVANKTGTDIDGIADSINKLSVNMGKDGDKFRKIGIDAKDPIEAFKQLADIFNAIEDPQKRAAFAAEALGKSWKSAAPALSEGSQSIGEMVKRGQKLAGVTTDSANKADELNDSISDLKGVVGGLSTKFANSLVPSLTETTKAMTEQIEKGNTLYALLRGLAGLGKLPFDAIFGNVDMSNAGFLKDLEGQLTKLEGQRRQVDSNGGLINKWLYGSVDDLDKKILVTRNQLEALRKFGDKLPQPKPPASNPDKPPSDKDLNGFIGCSGGGGAKKATDPHENDYSNLVKTLKEKIAVQDSDLNSVEALTAAQKDYAKYQADVETGAIVLTSTQKKLTETLWDSYKAKTAQNEADKANRSANVLVGDYIKGNEAIVERINREQELALMTDRQRSISEALYRTEDEGAAIRDRIIRDIKDETAQKIALAKAEEELAAQKIKVSDATARSYDQQQSFQFGWAKAFQSYSDSASNAAKQATDVFAKASQTMEDALVSFAMTGKISFSSMASSIISDIIRMQARAATSGIMNSVGKLVGAYFNPGGSEAAISSGSSTLSGPPMPSAKGNVFSSPALSAYSGSVVSTPTIFPFAKGVGLMGEAGAEGIFPLKRGPDGKLGVSADGSGVTVNVINNSGAQASTQQRSDGRGNKIIDVLIEQTKNAIAGDISSGNGAIPAALAGSYGLKRGAGAY